jgi:uncharacterized protein YutE (UPF0331/DUF86 family)
MTDADLVAKKLAFIETCVEELTSLGRPELIQSDIRERRFIEHTLQIAIQAVVDIASHITSEDRLGEPNTNRELIALLVGRGWLTDASAPALEAAIGFRNVLVHSYTVVDPALVRDAVENHLGVLTGFVDQIRKRLPE